MAAGGDRERDAADGAVGRAGRGVDALVLAVDQHLDLLAAMSAGAGSLRRLERDLVGPCRQDGRLADRRAGPLQVAGLAPSGAGGLELVMLLPLPATPAMPVNVQGVPGGAAMKSPGAPLPTAGVSKPESPSDAVLITAT